MSTGENVQKWTPYFLLFFSTRPILNIFACIGFEMIIFSFLRFFRASNPTAAGEVYENGIFFIWDDVHSGGCWSALGRAPGFSNVAGKSMQDIGAPELWQSLGLADAGCGGMTTATIEHEERRT